MGKTQFTVCAVFVFLFTFPAASHAGYSGGTGKPNSPFEIGTVADWQQLMDTPGEWDKHFVLIADLDMNGVAMSPVGNDPNNFTGVFYGKGHAIRNADINTPDSDYVGLFGYVGQEGAILNLGVEDVTISGNDYVGGLVGRNEAGGLPPVGSCLLLGLNKCYSTGSVSGNSYVGGLVGDNYGDLHMCYAAVSVTGNTKIGGLVGGTNQENIGGLDLGNMHECYSTGSVSGNSYVGGLLGDNYGLIDTCYATGSVTGNARVGGLVGGNGKADFPGPRGEARGYIHGCYSTGSVSGSSHVGGLVGYHEVGTVSHSFWDIETSEQLTSQGGVDKTTDQMKTLSTFTSANWTFVGEKANSSSGFWRMCADGVHYPRLNWEFRQYADFICPDGVGLEDFGYLGGPWLIGECDSPANLDGDEAIGFGDLMILCEHWLVGR